MFALCYLAVVFGSSWQKGNYNKKYDSICNVNVLDEASEIYKRGISNNKYGSSNTKETSSFNTYKESSTSSEPSWKRNDDSGKYAAINPWSMHTSAYKASKSPSSNYKSSSSTSKDKYGSDNSKYSLMKEHSYARKK